MNKQHYFLFISAIVAIAYAGNEPQPDCQRGFSEIENINSTIHPMASNMNVYIINPGPPDTIMCVKCWSGNHDKDTCGCGSMGETKKLSWSFTAGATTKFWCEGAWGPGRWNRRAKLEKFAVFGDGVPKKSSDWRVDAAGVVRFQEDGNAKDDNKHYWLGTKP